MVIIFVAIFYGIIIFFGGSKGEGDKSSNASRNGSYPSDTLGVSSNDTSHNTSSNDPTNNSTASAGGDFSGNSSNSQSENTSVDTSSDSSSSKDATSSKNETSSTGSVPTGSGTTQDGSVLLVNENHIEYEIVNNTLKITEFHQDWQGTVAIPETIMGYTVTAIGEEAFAGYYTDKDITGIKIPKTVVSIEPKALYNSDIVSVEVNPQNPVYYSEGNCVIERSTMTVVAGCKSSVIPQGVKKIGEGAFYMLNMDYISIPDSVTEIQRNGFAECYGLKILNLPSNLKTIGDFAFFGCEFEENLVIPDTVTYLGKFGLTQTELKNVTFGRGVNKIPERFFSASLGLETVKIPKNITEIESYAFDGCIQLTDVYFEGTEQERNQMIIGEGNESLLGATWHYESY